MAEITQIISSIPLLKHRDTVINFPQDQDEFVTKYEATNDHLAINTVPELNVFKTQANDLRTEVNGLRNEVVAKEALISPHYTAINSVYANEANINNVSTNMGKITNLDTNMPKISNVDTNMSDINLIADSIQGGALPTIIDDTTSSTLKTYSSSKIDSQISAVAESIDLSSKQDVLVSGNNIKTINSESILSNGNLALLTSTNPVITGSITEQVYSLTGTEINPANGTIQYKTVSANTTFTETLTSGQSVILRLIDANSYTITFPTITWVGAVAPILTADCAIVLWKEQTTLYGAYVGTLV